ncbi:MAG: hypothetical protein AAGA85_20595, partial [Bacteroidota bacterium]
MKSLLRAVLGGVCLFASAHLPAQSLDNIRAVTTEGRYSNPVWSPDGSQLLLTTVNNDELFVLPLEKPALIQKVKEGVGVGYMAHWSSDGSRIIFRESRDGFRSNLMVKELDLSSNQERELPNLHPTQIRSIRGGANQRAEMTQVYLNLETLKVEAKLGPD